MTNSLPKCTACGKEIQDEDWAACKSCLEALIESVESLANYADFAWAKLHYDSFEYLAEKLTKAAKKAEREARRIKRYLNQTG